MNEHPVPPFLRLPIELRYAIYDHLCLSSPRSYPYKDPFPITAIDTTGPPLALLLLNHNIFSEISTYYFARCTFRFTAQSFGIRPKTISPSSLHIVHNMRKVELLLLPGKMLASLVSLPDIEIKAMAAHWLDEHISLLRDEATELRTVVISMRSASWVVEGTIGEEMKALSKLLEEIRRRVEFRVGEVVGPDALEDSMKEELAAMLKRLNG